MEIGHGSQLTLAGASVTGRVHKVTLFLNKSGVFETVKWTYC